MKDGVELMFKNWEMNGLRISFGKALLFWLFGKSFISCDETTKCTSIFWRDHIYIVRIEHTKV